MLPDPSHGVCCQWQGFSSCTFLYCNFQAPNSLNPGCKLPGCKQGYMLLEQWCEWEDENFECLLWEESFSLLFLKQDLYLFVSNSIICFSNHCFMLQWQGGLLPLPICICSPYLPQSLFLLDSSSVFLDLLLCLGFPKSSFLLDSQSVYAIHICSGKTQISLYQDCLNQIPLTSPMLFYMPLEINILKRRKRKPFQKGQEANTRNINILRFSM